MSSFEILPGNEPFTDEELIGHAALLCMLTDKRADDDDILPDDRGRFPYRGGFWGDVVRDDGIEVGSKLWLGERDTISEQSMRLDEERLRDCFNPLLDIGMISGVDVSVWRYNATMVAAHVTFTYNDGTTTDMRFDDIWEGV